MEKLRLELKILEQEANYQNRLSDWESGELVSAEKSNLTNQISDLKEKGEGMVQKGISQANKVVDNLKSKGDEIVKGLTGSLSDKFKGLKDKKEDLLKSS